MEVVGLLSLLVELQAGMAAGPERKTPTMGPVSSQSPIIDEVFALASSISDITRTVLNVHSTIDPTIVRMPAHVRRHRHPLLQQVTTTVQLLRFSNYLSGLNLAKQIDYSALRVVMRWINKALENAPSGFESVIVLAEKLNSFVRLSSGWGFYDIWNAFLAVTPPNDGKSLEVLEKVSSVTGNTGKRMCFVRGMGCRLHCSDIRRQVFHFSALCTLPTVLSDREVWIIKDLGEKFKKVCFTDPFSYWILKSRSAPSCFSSFPTSHLPYFFVLACSATRTSNSGLHWKLGTLKSLSVRVRVVST